MSRSIICGVDGSNDSRAALELAAQLAKRLGVSLVLAHVAELVHIPYPQLRRLVGWRARTLFPKRSACRRKRPAACSDQVASEAGLVDVERKVAVGSPAEGLADLADEQDAELIAVGSRGRGAFKAAFLGSVSTSLVGVSRCPVLIVPPGATDPQ